MIHRIACCDNDIPEIYFKRDMVIEIDGLIDFITNLENNGLKAGSLEDTLKEPNHFHLTFDDGFKEHLEIARKLKRIFDFGKKTMTFAINVGNSITSNYSGMDVLYTILEGNGENIIDKHFGINIVNTGKETIKMLKRKIVAMSPNELDKIRDDFILGTEQLSTIFLNRTEIKELAQIATISSHGMTHRDLINHPEISKQEMKHSKRVLEELVGEKIQIFCYPEGKCNLQIQQFCRDAGYDFGLSIVHQQDDPYCIGRYCINQNREEIMRRVHE